MNSVKVEQVLNTKEFNNKYNKKCDYCTNRNIITLQHPNCVFFDYCENHIEHIKDDIEFYNKDGYSKEYLIKCNKGVFRLIRKK